MQTTIDRSAVEAMHNRARQLVLTCGYLGNAQNLRFAQGCLSSLSYLLDGGGVFLATRDASIGGYQPVTGFEAAWAALPVSAKNFSLAEVQELLRVNGVELSPDAVTDSQISAVRQLKDREVAAVNLDDEHPLLCVDPNNGAGLHGAAFDVESRIVKPGIINISPREQALIAALSAIVAETMAYPPTAPQSSESYLPEDLILAGIAALGRYGVSVPSTGAPA